MYQSYYFLENLEYWESSSLTKNQKGKWRILHKETDEGEMLNQPKYLKWQKCPIKCFLVFHKKKKKKKKKFW